MYVVGERHARQRESEGVCMRRGFAQGRLQIAPRGAKPGHSTNAPSG